MVVGEWSFSDDGAYMQRSCSWCIPMATFSVGGTTPVNQTQKVRFQDKSLLIIELTTSTPEVPYGTAFQIEQQYEIFDMGNEQLHLKTGCGILWITNPWGASMVSGTIESRSFEETTKSTCHLLALIEQDLKVEHEARLNREKKPPRKVKARIHKSEKSSSGSKEGHRGKSSKEKAEASGEKEAATSKVTISVPNVVEPSAAVLVTEVVVPKPAVVEPDIPAFKSISLPRTEVSTHRDETSNSLFVRLMGKAVNLFRSFLASDLFQIICLFIIFIMVLVFYSRVTSLENQVSLYTQQEGFQQVQFLKKFVKDVAVNLTGDPGIMESHFNAWKLNRHLEVALSEWQTQIVNLLKYVRIQNDASSPKALDLTQELLRKLDEHSLFVSTLMPHEPWSSWLFYWGSVWFVIALCFIVLFYIPKTSGKEKMD